MRIVIDTNVVISGTFFGGNPRKVLEAVVDGKIGLFGVFSGQHRPGMSELRGRAFPA